MFRYIIILGLALVGTIGSISIASPTSSQNDIRYAQQILTDAGFTPGPVDGIMGKNTRSANGQYQEKAGLPITGNVDATTLAAIRKGESQTGEEVTKPDTVASTPSAKKTSCRIFTRIAPPMIPEKQLHTGLINQIQILCQPSVRKTGFACP